MADSLLDLESTPLWFPDNIINWKKAPALDFEISKTIHGYMGTGQEFLVESEKTPRKWTFDVLNPNKQAEYELLEAFVYTHQGRKKRFWFPVPLVTFVLNEFIPALATEITVKDNGLDYTGNERFFMKLKNGDKITRKIENMVRFEEQKILVLTVVAMPGSPIYPGDIEFFTFLPLCRFDQDAMKPKHETHFASVATVRLKELFEYTEI